MLQAMAVRFVLAALRASVKNRAKKKELRLQMLDIFNAIRETYADDPAFQ